MLSVATGSKMLSRSYQLKHSLFATFAVLLVAGIMISLGIWQLERADEKTRLMATWEEHGALKAIKLDDIEIGDNSLYRHVLVTGHFEPNYFLLNNQFRQGKVGFDVISPLRLANGGRVLVNRGWISASQNITDLPKVETPEQNVQLVGRLNLLPSVGYKLKYIDTPGWPKLVQYLDAKLLANWFDAKIVAQIIQLDAAQDYGFNREWPGFSTHPEKHQAYALQWFLMATVLLTSYIFFSIKKVVGSKNGESKSLIS